MSHGQLVKLQDHIIDAILSECERGFYFLYLTESLLFKVELGFR